MAYPEKRKGRDGRDYYRGRYKRPDGKYGTVSGPDGKAIKYPTKRTALKAAQDAERDAETAAGRGAWVAPEAGRTTFAEYAVTWMAARDLAVSTMQGYGHDLKHLLPTFGEIALSAITGEAVNAWEKEKRAAGRAVSSVRGYRAMLHLILADAVDEGIISSNPAARRRGRGKRAGRSGTRGPEKKITTALGALLLAERMALLSGRDDEFVAGVTMAYTGLRWGEVVGLEPLYVRAESIRVEQQLYELDSGELVRCPPKDDSYRDLDIPAWEARLLSEHAARSAAGACPCHGTRFVFHGRGPGGGGRRQAGPTLKDVAALAGVSAGTVSNVLNRPVCVTEATRLRVEKAVGELGFVRRTGTTGEGAHWKRSGFATWIFEPAASGWYPPKAPYPRRPVPVTAGPWPGVPVRGRAAADRAEASWVPIQGGLTRHGLRHGHRTLMEEIGTPKVLMDERMGHADSSVSARYAHVTAGMRQRLVEGLTEQWEEALDARLALCPSSQVAVLDALLRGRLASQGADHDRLPGGSQ